MPLTYIYICRSWPILADVFVLSQEEVLALQAYVLFFFFGGGGGFFPGRTPSEKAAWPLLLTFSTIRRLIGRFAYTANLKYVSCLLSRNYSCTDYYTSY